MSDRRGRDRTAPFLFLRHVKGCRTFSEMAVTRSEYRTNNSKNRRRSNRDLWPSYIAICKGHERAAIGIFGIGTEDQRSGTPAERMP